MYRVFLTVGVVTLCVPFPIVSPWFLAPPPIIPSVVLHPTRPWFHVHLVLLRWMMHQHLCLTLIRKTEQHELPFI